MIMQWRKWDGSAHWRHESVYLGADAWGDWVGQPVGWRSARPGRDFRASSPNVTLIPAGREDYALTVNRDHPKGMRIYIDLGWEVRWSDGPLLMTGIDMDLDVVRVEGDRGTWVDDRDEWAEHSAAYGYPAAVMTHLEALALDLETAVRSQHPPFDDATADLWLDRLAQLALDCPA
jgi:protein associated with RNAse G/E